MPRHQPQHPTSSVLSVDRSVVMVLFVLLALHGAMLALLFGLQPPISSGDRGVEHHCHQEFSLDGNLPNTRRDMLCDRLPNAIAEKV